MTKQEKAAYNKAYRQANKAKIAAKKKAYYQANKDEYAAYGKVYRQVNKAEIAAQKKAYRKANPARHAARDKTYNKEHKAERATYDKVHYQANKDRIAARMKAWYKANPDKVFDNCARRRARKRSAFVEHVSRKAVYKRDGGRCHLCGKKVGKRWHLDHIIPLSRGGEHSYRNVAVAHPKCNLRKHNGLAGQLRLI